MRRKGGKKTQILSSVRVTDENMAKIEDFANKTCFGNICQSVRILIDFALSDPEKLEKFVEARKC